MALLNCGTHHLPAWQAVIEEQGSGACKRWIFRPVCRECRKTIPSSERKRGTERRSELLTLTAARERARVMNAAHIAAIATKAAATRTAKRLGDHSTVNGVVAEAMVLTDLIVSEAPALADILEGDHPAGRKLNYNFMI